MLSALPRMRSRQMGNMHKLQVWEVDINGVLVLDDNIAIFNWRIN